MFHIKKSGISLIPLARHMIEEELLHERGCPLKSVTEHPASSAIRAPAA